MLSTWFPAPFSLLDISRRYLLISRREKLLTRLAVLFSLQVEVKKSSPQSLPNRLRHLELLRDQVPTGSLLLFVPDSVPYCGFRGSDDDNEGHWEENCPVRFEHLRTTVNGPFHENAVRVPEGLKRIREAAKTNKRARQERQT